MEEGTGFSVSGMVTLQNDLPDNLQIIGAHLHTGSSVVNGPVNIIFCGGPPLPGLLGINGECTDIENETPRGYEGMELFEWHAMTSKGAWADGGNKATSIASAENLADGAATTYETFMKALSECTNDSCDVYFNIHTNYSFSENPGYGLARGQLYPNHCPDDVNATKCWGGVIDTEKTNMVNGLNNTLPVSAGAVTPLQGENTLNDIIVMYSGHDMDDDDDHDSHDHSDDKTDPDMTEDDSGAVASSVMSVTTIASIMTWVLF
jgi:hypothetical protein